MKRKSLGLLVASLALTALPAGNAGAALISPVCVASPVLSCRFACVDGVSLFVLWVGVGPGGGNASCGGVTAACSTTTAQLFCSTASLGSARATSVGTCSAQSGVAICSVYPQPLS